MLDLKIAIVQVYSPVILELKGNKYTNAKGF